MQPSNNLSISILLHRNHTDLNIHIAWQPFYCNGFTCGEVAVEKEIDLFHGEDLTVAAAAGSAFHAKDGAEGGLAD